jgi:hypothetical protein
MDLSETINWQRVRDNPEFGLYALVLGLCLVASIQAVADLLYPAEMAEFYGLSESIETERIQGTAVMGLLMAVATSLLTVWYYAKRDSFSLTYFAVLFVFSLVGLVAGTTLAFLLLAPVAAAGFLYRFDILGRLRQFEEAES